MVSGVQRAAGNLRSRGIFGSVANRFCGIGKMATHTIGERGHFFLSRAKFFSALFLMYLWREGLRVQFMDSAARAQSAQRLGGAEFLAFLEAFFCGFLFGLLHVVPPVFLTRRTGPVEPLWAHPAPDRNENPATGATISVWRRMSP